MSWPSLAPKSHQPRSANCMPCWAWWEAIAESYTSAGLLLFFGGGPRGFFPGSGSVMMCNPAEGYDSAIACHLSANKACSRRYEVGDFSVLTRAMTNNHLNVLDAVYISVLNPVLCKQKSFRINLTLFQRTQRTHPSYKLVDTCTEVTRTFHTRTLRTHTLSTRPPTQVLENISLFLVLSLFPLYCHWRAKGRKSDYGKTWGPSAAFSLG